MLKPTFRLTKYVLLDVYRRTQGSYVEGHWVDGDAEIISVKASVQPMKIGEIMSLPESDRNRVWLKVYSDSEMRASQEGLGGWDGDEFIWQGYRYKVMKHKNYAVGVLNHWCVYAARMPVSAGMEGELASSGDIYSGSDSASGDSDADSDS